MRCLRLHRQIGAAGHTRRVNVAVARREDGVSLARATVPASDQIGAVNAARYAARCGRIVEVFC
jgi:hypothetical protein